MAEKVSLKPLICSSCGGALALGLGKSARCTHCQTENPIPAEYGTLQRAARSFQEDRNLAEQLYGRLGRPPGRWAMLAMRSAEGSVSVAGNVGFAVLAVMAAQPLIGIALLMASAYVIALPVAGLLRLGFRAAGADPGPLPPAFVLAVTTPLVMLGFGVPVVRFGKERALGDVRKDIHASLAASLPERPGGPSLCRTCGGALDVPTGALGVPCTYCRSDNLVALPGEWVAHVRSKEFQHFLGIDAALESFRRAEDTAREKLWALGLGVVLVFPLVMVLAWLLDSAGVTF